jgi:serine-type D-Ala-D-Ala carboxypeptidase/endopeptidase (penicillin-binding protein 4)
MELRRARLRAHLRENTIELNITADPGFPGGTAAEWVPNVDYYTLENTMTPTPAGQTAHPGLDRRPGALLVRAWGTTPANGLHAGLAIEDPAEFTAAAFKQALLAAAFRERLPVSRHKSFVETAILPTSVPSRSGSLPSAQDVIAAPLEDRRVLATHVSDSPGPGHHRHQQDQPEPARRTAAAPAGQSAFGTDGSFAQGSRVVRQFLVDAGVNDADFFLYDGSGMSPDDRIAPRAFTLNCSATPRVSPGARPWRDTCRRRRGWHAGQPLQDFTAQGPSVGQDRHAERNQRL